jgi:hypothetical protein
MPRRVYLLGLGLALVALAFVLTDALLWEPGVTEANVKRIRSGMSLREVEAILGGPGNPIFFVSSGFSRRIVAPLPNVLAWRCNEGWATLFIDSDGRVENIHWFPSGRTRPGPLARLRAWLGW